MEAEAFTERVLGEVTGGLGVFMLYIGHNLKLWPQLRKSGSVTAKDFAKQCNLNARYIKEWLHCCATHGYITFDASTETFTLPEGHAVSLCDTLNPSYVGAFTTWLPNFRIMPQLLEAFKNGGGVPYRDYGEECIAAVGGGNLPMYTHELVEWFEAIPDINKKLKSGGRLLDVGCGTAVSTIALAKAFPNAVIDCLDCDDISIAKAKINIEKAGMKNRITLHNCFAHEANIEKESCDLISFFECLHDMANPVEVLKSVKPFLKPGGVVFIADERVEDKLEDMLPKAVDGSVTSFSKDDKNFMGRFCYSFSVMHCLPQAMVYENSEAIGACMHASTMKDIAKRAGFSTVKVVHQNSFWRFYRVEQ